MKQEGRAASPLRTMPWQWLKLTASSFRSENPTWKDIPPELQLPKILQPSHFQHFHHFSQGLSHARGGCCIGPGSEPQCCGADKQRALATELALLRFLGLAELLKMHLCRHSCDGLA